MRVPAPGSRGVVERLELLELALGPVVDDEPEGAEHRHRPGRGPVELVADAALEEAHLGAARLPGDPHAFAEVPDRGRRIAAPAHSAQRRHARVAPAVHQPPLDELGEAALAHHRVLEIETGELDLPWPGGRIDVVEDPVVQRTVILEFEGAQGMGDPFDGVREHLREVVGGVDAPVVAGMGMGCVPDAVEHRIAQVEVPGGHVDPGPEHVRPVGKLPAPHPREEVEALPGGTIPPRAFPPGTGQGSPRLADLVRRLAVHVGEPGPDEVTGVAVHLLEVVGGVPRLALPSESEPAHVVLDRLHVLPTLLERVGVVEAKAAEGRPVSPAIPKLRHIDFACPMWR